MKLVFHENFVSFFAKELN